MSSRRAIVMATLLGAMTAREDVAQAAPKEWIFASVAPDGTPAAEALRAAGRLLEEVSGGAIKVKYRLGGILGDETDMVRLCQKGQIQLSAGTVGGAVPVLPELRALETPYLFPDPAATLRVGDALQRGDRGDRAMLRVLGRKHGLELSALVFVGWRAIVSVRKPIHSPRDLHRLRVRAQPSDLHPVIWQALGASPKSFGVNELNSALDVDLVDAFDLPTFMLFATNLVERVRFVTQARHVASIGVFLINAGAFASLTPAAQSRFRARAPSMAAQLSNRHIQLEDELTTLLPQRGVQVITPTAAEMAEFRAALRPVEAYVRRTGSKQELELLDLAQRIVREGAGK